MTVHDRLDPYGWSGRVLVCESFHRFDLPEGSRHYEDVAPNHETGVDLLIAVDPPMWMEVKNYDAPTIPERHRERVREQFGRDSQGGLWERLAEKAVGTHDTLTALAERPAGAVLSLGIRARGIGLAEATFFSSLLEKAIAGRSELVGLGGVVIPLEQVASLVPGTEAGLCMGSGGTCDFPMTPRCSSERREHRVTTR